MTKISKKPIVKIAVIDLNDNNYVNYGKKWKALTLIEHSKKFKPFDLPLAGIDLTRRAWGIDDMDDFIHHMNRCKNTSLEHPIILDKYGVIADGIHRVCKAIVLGKSTIKAIRLESMPDHDSLVEAETKND